LAACKNKGGVRMGLYAFVFAYPAAKTVANSRNVMCHLRLFDIMYEKVYIAKYIFSIDQKCKIVYILI
jgi:hypothetical protein